MSDQATPAPGPQPITRRDLEARIIAKAWRDPEFKRHLLHNPHGVVQHELKAVDPSIVLPAGLQVQVHEESPNLYHLVLPRNPRDISLGEVLGDNLEALAPQTVAVLTVNTSVTNVLQAVLGVANINVNVTNSVVVVGNVATNVVGNVVGNVNVNLVAAGAVNANAVANTVA
jgi:hypothetical protein